jgi:hypothetical protein
VDFAIVESPFTREKSSEKPFSQLNGIFSTATHPASSVFFGGARIFEEELIYRQKPEG